MKNLSIPWIAIIFQLASRAAWGDDVLTECSCDCCEVEVLEESTAETQFQCAQVQFANNLRSPYRAQHDQCSATFCERHAGDYVLAAASKQVDMQRFCFFECEPKSDKALGFSKSPQRGDMCQSLQGKEVNQVQDQSGNAANPMDAPGVMSHFIARKARAAVKRVVAAAARAAKGGKPWSSIEPPASEMGARATEDATSAAKSSAVAEAKSKFASEVQAKTAAALPSSIASVEVAMEASSRAHKSEVEVNEIRQEVTQAAMEATRDMIKDELKKLRKEAHKKAKEEAVKKAKALKAKMLAEAPKAAKEAAIPYKTAQKRAAATAQQYAARGDALSAESTTVQMDAQMLLGQANTYMTLGEVGKSQQILQQSHQMMDEAVGLANQANGFYNTAQTIMSTITQYMGEAQAASYNAQVMLDPDVPPPPPPMV